MLFAPAGRPDRVVKALAGDAGIVCADCEDSVPAESKGEARTALAALLDSHPTDRLAFRINALTTGEGIRDLAVWSGTDLTGRTVFVPKVESAQEIRICAASLPGTSLIPLIETPRGLAAAYEIAAQAQVSAVMFGGGDMSAELNVELAWEPLLYARNALLMACARAGKSAIDVPFIALDDDAGLETECARAAALGFAAKAAIHPRQIAAIEAAFAPDDARVELARAAIEAFDAAGGRAVRFRGTMLEEPVMRSHRRVIEKLQSRRQTDA